VIQLINSQRISAGKSALGFLNPFLYSATQGLTDITSGGNGGCTALGGGFKAIAVSFCIFPTIEALYIQVMLMII
jgi:tripeptidyl-peptidase-1